VLARIVRDEAAHGVFGFTFLDWAGPRLGEEDRRHLGRIADHPNKRIADLLPWNVANHSSILVLIPSDPMYCSGSTTSNDNTSGA